MKKITYFLIVFGLMTLSLYANSISLIVKDKTDTYFPNKDAIVRAAKIKLEQNLSDYSHGKFTILNSDDTQDIIDTQREQGSLMYGSNVESGDFIGAEKIVYMTINYFEGNGLSDNAYSVILEFTDLRTKKKIVCTSRKVMSIDDISEFKGSAIDEVTLQLFDKYGIKLSWSERKNLQYDKKEAQKQEEKRREVEEAQRRLEEEQREREAIEEQRRREDAEREAERVRREEEEYRKRLEKERKEEEKRIKRENFKASGWGRHTVISTNFGFGMQGIEGFDFDFDLSIACCPFLYLGYNLDVIIPSSSKFYNVNPDASLLVTNIFKLGINIDCVVIDLYTDFGFGCNYFANSGRYRNFMKFDNETDYIIDNKRVDPVFAWNVGGLVPLGPFAISCNYTKTFILLDKEKKINGKNPSYGTLNFGLGFTL